MSKFIDLDSDFVINGPLIPFADSRPLAAPAPFADAVDHWRFGGGAGSRVGLVNGRRMSLGMTQTAIVAGSGYTSDPVVTASGAGATGLTFYAERNGAGTAVATVHFSGQPADDTGAVTVALSGGGGSGAAATISRGAEPTYSAAYATLATGRQNGLITDIDDAVSFTEMYLIKRSQANFTQRVGGSGMETTYQRGIAIGGDRIVWNSSNLAVYTANMAFSQVAAPASLGGLTWGVVALSNSPTGRTLMAFGPDGASASVTQAVTTGPKNVASPMHKRTIGAIYSDATNDAPAMDISSYAYWNSALSAGQVTSKAYDMLDYARTVGLIA